MSTTTIQLQTNSSATARRLQKANAGRPKRSRRTNRTAVGVLTTLVALFSSVLFSASPASAAPTSALSYQPTFECSSNTLSIDQVKLQEGIGSVRVQAEIDVYTGTKWVISSWSSVQTVDTNAMFSELAGPSWNFNAAHNRYYDVFIYTSVNGGQFGYFPAQAMRDHYSQYICRTS